jgi:hypothetical protein
MTAYYHKTSFFWERVLNNVRIFKQSEKTLEEYIYKTSKQFALKCHKTLLNTPEIPVLLNFSLL